MAKRFVQMLVEVAVTEEEIEHLRDAPQDGISLIVRNLTAICPPESLEVYLPERVMV